MHGGIYHLLLQYVEGAGEDAGLYGLAVARREYEVGAVNLHNRSLAAIWEDVSARPSTPI